ncbi:LysR substrate-binding domain-containing protein [Phaeovulum sp.]|uniref:LysR substrate-binding domain-containing protein n=1 Tax=Phaeovulum sp. TaxID=2934796 RepID=UPI0039E701D5
MSAPPLNALRTFTTVARLGSFRAAAEALCVTQSAISHQIRNIETWFGTPLFEREGNRIRIFPHGEELARRLTLSFAEIDAACNRTRMQKTNQPLVIAAIPSVATCWLIPRLSRFRTAHPKVEFRIVYAMHGRDINFQDVHLAFVFSQEKPTLPNVESQLFLEGQCLPVCSPALLQKLDHPPKSATDFQRLGLLHDCDTSGWTTWLAGLSDTNTTSGDKPLEGATFEDFNLLRAAVLSGQGVALCPMAMIRPDIDAGNLVQVSDRMMKEGYDYYLLSATSAEPLVNRQAQVFRDWAMGEREKALTTPTPRSPVSTPPHA